MQVIAKPGKAPEAVMGPACTLVSHAAKGVALCGLELSELVRWGRYVDALIPVGAIFDAELSGRWGCVVACTAAFSKRWRGRRDEPTGFFLEVLS